MTLTVTSPEGELETITTTTEHPFCVIEQGFIEAGQQLATARGKPVTLTEVNLTPITLTAYHYEIDFNHTYFVGKTQLWVHNACGGGSTGVKTPHTVNTGGKAPKTSEPNSIIESRRADGSSSVTYYDDKGRAFSREDYGQQSTHGSLGQRSDGRSAAHEHRFDYNDRGYPIKQDVYRELSETGTPVGPWIQNR